MLLYLGGYHGSFLGRRPVRPLKTGPIQHRPGAPGPGPTGSHLTTETGTLLRTESGLFLKKD